MMYYSLVGVFLLLFTNLKPAPKNKFSSFFASLVEITMI